MFIETSQGYINLDLVYHVCPEPGGWGTSVKFVNGATLELDENVADLNLPTAKTPSKKRLHRKASPDKVDSGRKPDVVWDAVVDLFFPSFKDGVPESSSSRIGKVVRDLKALGVQNKGEIQNKIDAYKRHLPDCAATPEAVVKHWDLVGDINQPSRGMEILGQFKQ